MQFNIQARDFSLTKSLRNHAERRLWFALTCFDNHIQRIVMLLSDINGPRGGVDKRCQLRIVLDGMPDVVIQDTEADLYVAIDRAANRAGRTLVRKLDRLQSLLRRSRQSIQDV